VGCGGRGAASKRSSVLLHTQDYPGNAWPLLRVKSAGWQERGRQGSGAANHCPPPTLAMAWLLPVACATAMDWARAEPPEAVAWAWEMAVAEPEPGAHAGAAGVEGVEGVEVEAGAVGGGEVGEDYGTQFSCVSFT